MTTTFETAKVGDRVWSMEYGWGEIVPTTAGETDTIKVMFIDGPSSTYTLEGRRLFTHMRPRCSANQTLFWDEVVIEAPQKPLPVLEVDAKVLVWFNPDKKHKRHFSHFGNGVIWTFDAGSTSFTRLHKSSISYWPNWEVVAV